MLQCMLGTLSRQRAVYRQRVAAAPVLLACETLSRAHVAQVLQALKVKTRERSFPPSDTLVQNQATFFGMTRGASR